MTDPEVADDSSDDSSNGYNSCAESESEMSQDSEDSEASASTHLSNRSLARQNSNSPLERSNKSLAREGNSQFLGREGNSQPPTRDGSVSSAETKCAEDDESALQRPDSESTAAKTARRQLAPYNHDPLGKEVKPLGRTRHQSRQLQISGTANLARYLVGLESSRREEFGSLGSYRAMAYVI